jgi:hypothetical protein
MLPLIVEAAVSPKLNMFSLLTRFTEAGSEIFVISLISVVERSISRKY